MGHKSTCITCQRTTKCFAENGTCFAQTSLEFVMSEHLFARWKMHSLFSCGIKCKLARQAIVKMYRAAANGKLSMPIIYSFPPVQNPSVTLFIARSVRRWKQWIIYNFISLPSNFHFTIRFYGFKWIKFVERLFSAHIVHHKLVQLMEFGTSNTIERDAKEAIRVGTGSQLNNAQIWAGKFTAKSF